MERIGHAHACFQEAHERVFRHIRLGFRHDQHLDAGEDQEGAEQIEHPAIALHQCGTRRDHHTAHDEHGNDAPDQRPVLILPRDREKPKISEMTKTLSIESAFSMK